MNKETCSNPDQYNCKYCRSAGISCDGSPGLKVADAVQCGPRFRGALNSLANAIEPRLPWPKPLEPEERFCVHEHSYTRTLSTYLGRVVINIWFYHYSDDTVETVTRRSRPVK